MALVLSKMSAPKKDYGRVADGTYMGRIVQVVDLGIQKQTDWQTGESTDSKPRVMITYELPTERLLIEEEDGTTSDLPRWIQKEYTSSSFEQATLMKLISTIAPEATSVGDLINIPVMVAIGSTKTGNAKVSQVLKAPIGMPVPQLENPTVIFDFSQPLKEEWDKLPTWIKKKIGEAENFSEIADIVSNSDSAM